jgi:hypothetical protein
VPASIDPAVSFDRSAHLSSKEIAMFRSRSTLHQGSRLLAAALLALSAGLAAAAQWPYTFVTTGAPYGNVPGPVQSFEAGAVVSGQFMYDPTRPASGTLTNGATRYDATFLDSSGTVQGHAFSDPRGYTALGNNLPAMGGSDFLMLAADASLGSGTPSLVGFTIDGWTLVNVRLFWIGDMPGVGDFLGSAVLPDELPGLPGRLALDFVPVGSPTGPVSSVFFDGLAVTAVPEPASAALMAAGLLGILGWRLRQRPAGR